MIIFLSHMTTMYKMTVNERLIDSIVTNWKKVYDNQSMTLFLIYCIKEGLVIFA